MRWRKTKFGWESGRAGSLVASISRNRIGLCTWEVGNWAGDGSGLGRGFASSLELAKRAALECIADIALETLAAARGRRLVR